MQVAVLGGERICKTKTGAGDLVEEDGSVVIRDDLDSLLEVSTSF